MDKSFQKYIKDFEDVVIETGVAINSLGVFTLIPIRPGKLLTTVFGRSIGSVSASFFSFAIDYYGFIKPSRGLIEDYEMRKQQLHGRQLRKIGGLLVHFASLKIEEVDRLSNSNLTAGFPKFKKTLIEMRGFKKGVSSDA